VAAETAFQAREQILPVSRIGVPGEGFPALRPAARRFGLESMMSQDLFTERSAPAIIDLRHGVGG
jgi:hypothetical protein